MEGHRDEVLSTDFNFTGTTILSCGMDHSLKVWDMDVPAIRHVVQELFKYQGFKSNVSFKQTFGSHAISQPYFQLYFTTCSLIVHTHTHNDSLLLWEFPHNSSEFPSVLDTFPCSCVDCVHWWYCPSHVRTVLCSGNL